MAPVHAVSADAPCCTDHLGPSRSQAVSGSKQEAACRFTKPLTKRTVRDERPVIRAVCAILDAFHFAATSEAAATDPGAHPLAESAPSGSFQEAGGAEASQGGPDADAAAAQVGLLIHSFDALSH